MGNLNNQHGLSRDIPEDVKRVVRRRCGFGCVVCGSGIYHYDHLDPPFEDAVRHDPAGIILLCGGCHDKKTRGFLSATTVRERSLQPPTFKTGYTREFFDIGADRPRILLGGTIFEGMDTILRVKGQAIMQLKPPEEEGAPHRLSGIFCDSSGNEIFRIVDNEWQGSLAAWDIEASGGTLTIRVAPKKIALRLIVNPPDEVRVDRINMHYQGCDISGDSDSLEIKTPDGSRLYYERLGKIVAAPNGAGISIG